MRGLCRARPSSSLLTTAVQVLFALLCRKLMMINMAVIDALLGEVNWTVCSCSQTLLPFQNCISSSDCRIKNTCCAQLIWNSGQ